MDLWIRSQDKRALCKVGDLEVEKINKATCWDIRNDKICFGSYETEERALEILDDMQNWLETRGTDVPQMVYDMPEE